MRPDPDPDLPKHKDFMPEITEHVSESSAAEIGFTIKDINEALWRKRPILPWTVSEIRCLSDNGRR